MNAKNQLSSDNPGWRGVGIPSYRRLTVRQIPLLLAALKQGQLRGGLNLIRSAISNLWNFYGPRRLSSRVACPCCGWSGSAFIATSNWRETTFQSRCPQCDSRSRHRGLAILLPQLLEDKTDGRILIFAPEGIILKLLEVNSYRELIDTTDYNSQDVDFPGEDIQQLSFADDSYAMILCNHVLEHVPDDICGLQECHRVLKKGGVAVFTIPGNYSSTETKTWVFEKMDGNGHYRHYGMDIVEKMKSIFQTVSAINMSTHADPKWKVRIAEYAFVCVK